MHYFVVGVKRCGLNPIVTCSPCDAAATASLRMRRGRVVICDLSSALLSHMLGDQDRLNVRCDECALQSSVPLSEGVVHSEDTVQMKCLVVSLCVFDSSCLQHIASSARCQVRYVLCSSSQITARRNMDRYRCSYTVARFAANSASPACRGGSVPTGKVAAASVKT